METKHIHISDYNYDLPDSRIAKFPVSPRDTSKLLVYRHGEISDDIFYNLPKYLPQKSLMVFNNTKVIQARMHFRKETGALIEVFLMEPAAPTDYELMFQTRGECSWLCMVGNLKKWKEGSLVRNFDVAGSTINFKATMRRDIIDTKSGGTNYWVDFAWDNPQVSFAEILDAVGELPIPPYLNRETQDSDKTTYQTVYSKIKGSVAAPTAGLHFTDKVLAAIDAAGVRREELTLHVGAGTFKPVKSEEIDGHTMHTEYVCVRRDTLQTLLDYDCCAIAVGTTSVRTLESLYYMGVKLEANPDAVEEDLHVCQWEPYEKADGTPVDGNLIDGITPQKAISNIIAWLDKNNLKTLHSSTQIIIAPGYEYKIVKVLVTNFHQPQSTLLLLVSAFLKGDWRNVYDYALSHDFRFLSYGDSSILIP
ncbi:MAG: S-adenosylmethionine:tRNA ribosyltransferase-isomerase [Prevotella sp.]|nr:S-adenosylmethionine:tRNA ribosyltransferase-isomerase [Prevotella sp.]